MQIRFSDALKRFQIIFIKHFIIGVFREKNYVSEFFFTPHFTTMLYGFKTNKEDNALVKGMTSKVHTLSTLDVNTLCKQNGISVQQRETMSYLL